ncbi:MAG: transposase [Bacteroidales bacterium]|nr:transposase [Bacteroidales bacterium]
MDENKISFSLGILKHFINDSLGLDYDRNKITGFELLDSLVSASTYNTYIETIGDKADTLYRRIKESPISMTTNAYLNYIKRLSAKFKLNEKEVILVFDYTDEDFYGEVQGFDIHGWTGKDGITGKFKFLTCSIISDEIPEKIPLISVPINLGHYKSHVIEYCLSRIKPLIGEIQLILFDRGFYDKDLMYELTKLNYPYLIFVPKHQDKKSILYPMKIEEQVAIYNEFIVNKNQSKYAGENILIFLKQIYDTRSEKNYDLVFATNVEWILLEKIVALYKKRWRIETQFRVHDEARIKCKSKDMKIRYFLFLFEQMLQPIWICFYKDDVPFKKFLIEMNKVSKRYTKTQE